MMKRMLVVAAAVACVTSAVVAGPVLVNIPAFSGNNADGSMGTCITPDGVYVGGNNGALTAGFVWDAVHGSRQPVAGSPQASVYGIGYRYPSDGAATQLVIGGKNSGWESMNTSTDGGLTWLKNRRTNTHAYVGAPSGNTVAGSSSTVTPGRIYSTFQTSATVDYVDRWEGPGLGVFGASSPDVKSTSEESSINGVSNEGVAVGRRKNGGIFHPYTYTSNNAGGLAATYVAEMPGSTTGALWDIADNGTLAGGESGTSADPSGAWPYILKMADSTTYQLPVLIPGYTGSATKGRVYGMSPNGDYAVGMDYTKGYELAVLWDLSDSNPANWTETDLSQFCTDNGILGAFTGNLRRAYAVGVNAQGLPVVTGYGYAGSLSSAYFTGFVLTVPEPATLAFLALGGLAMLRRRR